MSLQLVSPLVASAVTRAAEESEKVNHWLVGGIALLILGGAMMALLAFGKGREHS